MFVGQLKKLKDNGNAIDAGGNQSMFLLTFLEKIRDTRIQFPEGSVTVLQKMANYEEVRVKLTSN